jgi:hypothetical protein
VDDGEGGEEIVSYEYCFRVIKNNLLSRDYKNSFYEKLY